MGRYQTRLPTIEEERLIREAERRFAEGFPGLLGTFLPGAISGGLSGILLTDDDQIMRDDAGNVMFVG